MEYRKYDTVLFFAAVIDNQLSLSASKRALLARVDALCLAGAVDHILMHPVRWLSARVVVVVAIVFLACAACLPISGWIQPALADDVPAASDPVRETPEQPSTGEPLKGSLNLDQLESGRDLKNGEPQRNKPFVLGAKQETIAWEKWHKRLVKEIMHRTEDRAVTIAKLGGIRISSLAFKTIRMQMNIVITNDKHVAGTVIEAAENPKLTQAMIDAVNSLDGDEIIAFPTLSTRPSVSMLFTYIRGPKVLPGTKWIKNDYEQVNRSSN